MLFVHLLSRCDEREAVVLVGLNPDFVDRVDRRKKGIGHGDVAVPANRGGDRPSVRKRCGGGMSVFGAFRRKLAALTNRARFNAELSEEIAFHQRQIEKELRDREGGGSPRRGHATVWKLHAG